METFFLCHIIKHYNSNFINSKMQKKIKQCLGRERDMSSLSHSSDIDFKLKVNLQSLTRDHIGNLHINVRNVTCNTRVNCNFLLI